MFDSVRLVDGVGDPEVTLNDAVGEFDNEPVTNAVPDEVILCERVTVGETLMDADGESDVVTENVAECVDEPDSEPVTDTVGDNDDDTLSDDVVDPVLVVDGHAVTEYVCVLEAVPLRDIVGVDDDDAHGEDLEGWAREGEGRERGGHGTAVES